MSSFNRSYGQSPPSPVSNGAFESIQGTPNTAITAISPEDARVPKPPGSESRTSSVSQSAAANQHDPFVTACTTSRASAQLSATASTFQPLHLYGTAAGAPVVGSLIANGSGPATLIPGTIQYLDNVVASQSPVRETEITSFGVGFYFSLSPSSRKVLIVYRNSAQRLVLPVVSELRISIRRLISIAVFNSLSRLVPLHHSLVYPVLLLTN